MGAFFPPASGGSKSSAIIGRDREMSALAAELDAAASGHGTLVLIAGEPGVGKTRLMVELAARAQDHGWQVLWGHAYDSAGMPPFLPFAEAIAQSVRRSAADGGARRLAEAAPEVALLVPELRRLLPKAVRQPSTGPEADRYRLFEAVSDFFLGLAGVSETTGLLLCFEDIHWADKPSLLLL
jgi:predicted ATPase